MSDNTTKTTTVGVILAGGTARRLGQTLKSALNVGGQPLLERVYGAIEGSCEHIILSVGQHQHTHFGAPKNCTILSDAGNGPASALRQVAKMAVARHLKAQYLLCVAVDTPLLPHDFATRAHAALTPDVDAVVATYGDQVYPTNILWRMSALTPKKTPLSSPPPRALFGMLDGCRWTRLDYARFQDENPFLNINTPADLVAANRALQSE